jgi:prolyl 4-hydroxylase
LNVALANPTDALGSLDRGADPIAAAAALRSAADRGDPDGFRGLAVLAAAGVGLPQSFPAALDALAGAATLGCPAARGQLRALASLAEDPADWPAMRAGIDLSTWERPFEKRVVNADPRAVAVEAMIPAAACAWLRSRAAGRLGPAMVFGDAAQAAPSTDRSNTAFEFAFSDLDVVALLTRRRIAACIGVPIQALETSQILHYDPGQAFAPHFDWLDPESAAAEIAARGQRIATVLVYLNDDFDGGETDFPRLSLAHRGREGDGFYFANLDAAGAPDRRTLHAGLAPTRGKKWVFSQWVRNRAAL